MPRSRPIALLGCPATNPSSTCRSRGVKPSRRSAISELSRWISMTVSTRWRAALIAAIIVSSSNGFSRKSKAPSFIASTARGTSPCPVIMMTGKRCPSAVRRRMSSKPSIPGMRMSVTTQETAMPARALRNAPAESKVLTAWPAAPSRNDRDSRAASSSSTIWIGGLSGIDRAFSRCGKREAEGRAPSRVRLRPDFSAMRFDNGAADRQTDAHAVRLRCDERLEQLGGDFLGYARPRIGHGNLHHVLADGGQGHCQLAARGVLHRIHGVAKQVHEDLLHLDTIDEHPIHLRVDRHLDPDAALVDADQGQRARFLDQLPDALHSPLGLAPRDEVAQMADDLARPRGLLGALHERILDRLEPRIGACLEQPARTSEVVADGGERLVELMGECRRHLAHGRQARQMHQLRLQFVKLGLGFLSVGQISHETREMAAGAGAHFADGKVHGEGRTVLAPPRDHASDADNMAFAGRFVSRHVAVMSAAVRFRHQDGYILSDRLRRI